MRFLYLYLTTLLLLPGVLLADDPAPAATPVAAPSPAAALYQQDCAKLTPDAELPDELLVLSGQFRVTQVGEDRCLEVAAKELDDFGLLFGPHRTGPTEVSARIRAASQGRRMPRFGVGLGGAGGWRLLLVPVRKQLQLWLDQEVVASVPCTWESGTFYHLRLRLSQVAEGQWRLDGQAWPAGQERPANWQLSHETRETPPEGMCAVFGAPYSGLPIQFDDLTVSPVP